MLEQAKGVLAERLALEPESAFALLRRAAQNGGRRVHDLAGEVVRSRHTPPEVAQIVVQLGAPPRPAE